jgi:hypothetical protein
LAYLASVRKWSELVGCCWHLWLSVNMFPFSFRTNRPIFVWLSTLTSLYATRTSTL